MIKNLEHFVSAVRRELPPLSSKSFDFEGSDEKMLCCISKEGWLNEIDDTRTGFYTTVVIFFVKHTWHTAQRSLSGFFVRNHFHHYIDSSMWQWNWKIQVNPNTKFYSYYFFLRLREELFFYYTITYGGIFVPSKIIIFRYWRWWYITIILCPEK